MNPQDAYTDMTLLEFVGYFDVSVRLRNCLKKATTNDSIPYKTVGELLAHGEIGFNELMKLQHYGAKCDSELRNLFNRELSEVKRAIDEQVTRAIDERLKEAGQIFEPDIELSDVFIGAGQRLRNLFNDKGKLGTTELRTINDVILLGQDKSRSLLIKQKNFGREAVKEFFEVINKFVEYRNKPSEYPRNIDITFLMKNYKEVFTPLIEEYRTPIDDISELSRILCCERTIRKFQDDDHLPFYLREYWYGKTLEDIGKENGLTRERIRQKITPYHQFMTPKDAIWVERSIRHLINECQTGEKLPPDEQIKAYHPELPRLLVQHFGKGELNESIMAVGGVGSSRRRVVIAHNLGLCVESEGAWTVNRVISTVKARACELGTPNVMPKQIELPQNMRNYISKMGGQQKVAAMAGLEYDYNTQSEDGSRLYWTDERIGKYLHSLAETEGHPGTMPSQKSVVDHSLASEGYSIVGVITRSVYPHIPTLQWYEVAVKHGLRYDEASRGKLTLAFIKTFVKSLGDALHHLAPAEIYVLFEQQGVKSGRTFDKLVEAIQTGNLPKEEIEAWTAGGASKLVEHLLDPNIDTLEEALKRGQNNGPRKKKPRSKKLNSGSHKENIEGTLPTSHGGDTLKSLAISTDLLLKTSSDEEAVNFLMAKATDKLWKRCFVEGSKALDEIRDHVGNGYSENAKEQFIEEYTRCSQMPIPNGYSFTDPTGRACPPKFMQKLIAYRVDKKERVLNLSGTGTGKTLSAVLASRVIGAQLTVVSCPNATVNGWEETIRNAYPESDILTKQWPDCWPSTGKPRYLVLNHEMFQDRNESRLKAFIEQNPYDLVVIDELHQVKQRDPNSESQRRRLLTGLITDIPAGRAKPRVLGMSATPIINNIEEGRSLVELVTSLKYDDIETKPNVANCMRMYQNFSRLGFRMLPKYNVDRLPIIQRVDATPLLDVLTGLGSNPHPQKVEAVLLRAKLPVILESISGKTVIFTEYVTDIVQPLLQKIREQGFSVGVYTGEEKLASEAGYTNSLQQFLKGGTQVLIASTKTLATGVDGLQYVCNNVIFATLPWTSSDYDQAVGRFDREGFVFDSLTITIPATFARLTSGEEWSWCRSRLRRIENKRDIAKAAVDGEIPDEHSRLTPQKATQYWMKWLERLNNEGLYNIDREKIKVPLDDLDEGANSRRLANYGEFSTLNARWNNANSGTTHERLQQNPEEWCYYHTMLLEHEKSWHVVPREKCLDYLKKNLPPNSVVGDFGCGRNTLAKELSEWHLVHSFDHVAIDNQVTQCDFSNTPLDDSTLDVAVFSLSLMGKNVIEYIEEAYRTLKLSGQLLVWDTIDSEANSGLRDIIEECGFAIISAEEINKWYNITAIKQAR